MKSFFFYSASLHAVLLAALVTVGTLIAKPTKSYYSIDLMSSMSSGGAQGTGPAVATPEPKAMAVPTPVAPKIKVPKMAPAPVRQAEEEEPAEDTMRLLAKLKKKRLTQAKQRTYEDSSNSDSRGSEAEDRTPPSRGAGVGNGGGAGGNLGAGPGISVGSGTPFPFPWYIKAIYSRLDKQWHPPSTYDPGTTCVVSFVIARDGQITASKISKSSRDSFFDGIALRAVMSANPMPPLPGGYPEETLDVHMTFLGK